MTHLYFSARSEGRISYGHLGRTDSCLVCVDVRRLSVGLWRGSTLADAVLCLIVVSTKMWSKVVALTAPLRAAYSVGRTGSLSALA